MRVRLLMIIGLCALISTVGPVSFASGSTSATNDRVFTFVGANLTNLNPLFNSASEFDNTLLFDGLISLNASGIPQPDLATSWTTSSNGTTITFDLRHGVTWSDGYPFTAQDVAYTYNSLINNATGSWAIVYFSDVQSVTAPDNYTAVFHLKTPSAIVLDSTWFGIIPEHIKGDNTVNSTYNADPIGTGPFILVSNDPGSSMTFKANPNYWGGRPYIDELIGSEISDPSTALAALETGSLNYIDGENVASGISASVLAQARANPNLVVQTQPSNTVQYLFFPNNPSPDPSPMNNVLVRQAISYAINRTQIVGLLFNGTAVPDYTIFPPEFNWANAPSIPEYQTNLTMSAALLDRAGYPLHSNGTRFSTTIYATSGTRVLLSQLIQAQLAKVGIATTIKTFPDFTSYTQQIEVMKDYSGFYTELHGLNDPNDLTQFFDPALINSSGDNGILYDNQTVGNWIAQARVETNFTQRSMLYQDISLAVAQADAFFPLYDPVNIGITTTGVHGITLSAFGGYSISSLKGAYLQSWDVGASTQTTTTGTPTGAQTTTTTATGTPSSTSATTSATTSTASGPNYTPYYVVGVVAILAVVIVATVILRRHASPNPSGPPGS